MLTKILKEILTNVKVEILIWTVGSLFVPTIPQVLKSVLGISDQFIWDFPGPTIQINNQNNICHMWQDLNKNKKQQYDISQDASCRYTEDPVSRLTLK